MSKLEGPVQESLALGDGRVSAAQLAGVVGTRDLAGVCLLMMATRDAIQVAYGITTAKLDEWKAAPKLRVQAVPRRAAPSLPLGAVAALCAPLPPAASAAAAPLPAALVAQLKEVCLLALFHSPAHVLTRVRALFFHVAFCARRRLRCDSKRPPWT